ncbi:MAG: glycoside hydrolase family 3 N-terminal domain-containing protein [Pseudomonadota bacterium]|nr:glycoside hydrolase family 3 N-terminal domain-containing protein [Pseudomonadota bacterium]
MSDEKISQLLMVGIIGESLSDFERSAWQRYSPGGVILFARNCVDPQKTRALVGELQEISLKSSGLPLIVAIDQEGGPVTRLKAGFPVFPGAAILGADADLEKTRTTALALAKALLEIGINCNLAPVADLFQASSRVLRDRCFGAEPELVAGQVEVYIEGLQSSGVAACVKHFPGHGTVVEDSHKMLPVSPLERSELTPHLLPFAAAIAADVKIMMAAHLKFPAIDSQSVPFSPLFLDEIARRELGFSGLMISDDLDMAAVADRPLAQVMVEGVKAGLDMALWGRNLKPVADLEPVMAEFCQNMQNCGLSKELLQAKIDRVQFLRKEISSGLKMYG